MITKLITVAYLFFYQNSTKITQNMIGTYYLVIYFNNRSTYFREKNCYKTVKILSDLKVIKIHFIHLNVLLK